MTVFNLAILVHGFNVHDGGRGSVGKLRPFFATKGIPYLLVDYGFFDLIKTYTSNKKVAKRLAEAVRNAKAINPDDKIVVVGHSNGCAIIYLACKHYNAPIDKAVFINPALDSDITRPKSLHSLDVWYSPSDKPVMWAKYLPWHVWGDMGRVGYTGTPDEMVRCFNKEKDYVVISDEHSDAFAMEELPFYGPLIVNESMNIPT